MKKATCFLSMLLAFGMVLGIIPGTALAANNDNPFTDVSDSAWYSSAVQYVYKHGMMNGTGTTQFSPDGATSRGMIVTILHRLEGTPAAAEISYSDVVAGKYYTEAVYWASANNIVNGYGNGKFGPDDPITREQMATILYRYAQYKEYDTAITGKAASYTDGDQVSSYAVDAMNWALGVGLINGVGNNQLSPTRGATRAQAAMILMRYCKDVVPAPIPLPENRVVGLVSDGANGSVVLCFDSETWEYTPLMTLPEVTPDNYAALSRDNQKLAYTTWDESLSRRYLKIYDYQTGKTTDYFTDVPDRTEIIKISWMPDSETLLYIRNNTELASFQTIELMNTLTKDITVVDKGEVWRVRTVTELEETAEAYFLPGSQTYLPVKYIEQSSDTYQWNYYLDSEDLRAIYKEYGGVKEFDFSTILSIMYVDFSAPRCSPDGTSTVYSAKLDRTSAPGEHTPLWVTAAIWQYDVETQNKKIIYKQEDGGAIGRVDWVSQSELCFVSYYDFQGSKDNINRLNISDGKVSELFHYTDEFYNNVTLLPIGNGKISFTSSKKDDPYENSKTYCIDVSTGVVSELDIIYKGSPVILEKFIFN